MANYLSRKISMFRGSSSSELTSESPLLSCENRGLQNFEREKSPLLAFVSAKKKINDIYGEIVEYATETTNYINSLDNEPEIVDKAEYALFQGYVTKLAAIREVLRRDNMKVAFFGRTSNGKSSVINAMLHDKILPSGIGHTTQCFCQVEGSDENEAYILTEDSDERQSILNLKQLANALCQEKLSESSLVRIFLPRERCCLLRDDVVFVDSPGVDVSANLDDWIDKHCLNADVFVLVLNAESTMTRAEKHFFYTVSQKLSKPNIFILNNRWDAASTEPELAPPVKQQHTERCIEFLTKELKVNSEQEAAERVFFVSARETLQARLEEAKGNPPHRGALADGFHLRYFEFQDFERKFEDCISQSAMRTKFAQHSARGSSVASEMASILDNVYDRTAMFCNIKMDQKTLLAQRVDGTKTQKTQAMSDMKKKIEALSEDVEQKVSKTLNDEIYRLGALIDEFPMPFITEPLVLTIYKKELNKHIESGLVTKLRTRLSTALALNLESTQTEMIDCMRALLPYDQFAIDEANINDQNVPFELLYSLNCQNLCGDFLEDLEFKFSWGFETMMQRFAAGKAPEYGSNSGQMSLSHSLQPRPLSNWQKRTSLARLSTENEAMLSCTSTPIIGIRRENLSLISQLAISSIGSPCTMGGLVAAGVVFKTLGWRLLAGVGALYGLIYCYERLLWTKSAKERAFKAQYTRHATKKLKMIVDLTATNCKHQVQQELSSTFAKLCHVVDNASTDMSAELKILETQLTTLDSTRKQLKLLRNKANYIQNELQVFEKSYLRPD